MNPLLLILVFIPAYFSTSTGQSPESLESPLVTTSKKYGQCELCSQCTNYLESNSTSNMRCCPSACATPEGLRGTCVGLHSCPRVLNMLRGNRSKASLEYFEESRCEGPDEYSVCCDQDRPSRGGHCLLTAYAPNRSTGCCGLNRKQNINEHLGGGNIKLILDEHPWLANIIYAKDAEIQILCGGALISGQYVVTAGHCVLGPMLVGRKLMSVTLGDPSCNGEEGADCSNFVIIPIENTTPHPDYEPYINPTKNDIALIKLTRIVKFTDYIRPLCLPSINISAAELTEDSGDVERPRHSVPIIAMPDLREMNYESSSYAEDPAGSLIVEAGGLFELVGMMTMRKKSNCEQKTIDGTYSSAHRHMSWIRSQIAAEVNLEDSPIF